MSAAIYCAGFYHDTPVTATSLAPQCSDHRDPGEPVEWVPVCDACLHDWYDGADFTAADIPAQPLATVTPDQR